MAAGRIAFVSNDAFMKFLFVDLSVFQAMFLRGLFAVPLIALIAWWHRCLFIRIGRLEFMLLVLRGGAQIGMASCFLLALSEMPIANVAAIMQALPLCLVMVAALCLGEMVGWRRWAAVVVGLFGVLMIIRPGTDAFSLYSLLALAAVGFATLNDAVTRYLPSRIPALFAAMFTAGAVCLFSGGMSIGDAWPTANEVNWPVVGLCAVTVAGGYLLQVMTMRQGDLSFVAPFRYVGLVWAIFLGVVLFAEWPDGWTLAGGGLVVAMGLYSFYADRNYGQRG